MAQTKKVLLLKKKMKFLKIENFLEKAVVIKNNNKFNVSWIERIHLKVI